MSLGASRFRRGKYVKNPKKCRQQLQLYYLRFGREVVLVSLVVRLNEGIALQVVNEGIALQKSGLVNPTFI